MAINEIGLQMKSIYSWIWITIFLFWLIFPIFVLLIKLIQLASIIQSQNDVKLNDAGNRLLWGTVLSLIPLGITQFIGTFLQLIHYDMMNNWAIVNNRLEAASGFRQLKNASILILIPLGITQFIGFIWTLIVYPKAANGMI